MTVVGHRSCSTISCFPSNLEVLFSFLIWAHLNIRLFGFNGGKLRMDERINLSMSDPDLVPLIIQVFGIPYLICNLYLSSHYLTFYFNLVPGKLHKLSSNQWRKRR